MNPTGEISEMKSNLFQICLTKGERKLEYLNATQPLVFGWSLLMRVLVLPYFLHVEGEKELPLKTACFN